MIFETTAACRLEAECSRTTDTLSWKRQVFKQKKNEQRRRSKLRWQRLFWANSNMSCYLISLVILVINSFIPIELGFYCGQKENQIACTLLCCWITSFSASKKSSCFQGSGVSRQSCNSYRWNCPIIVPSLNWFIHFLLHLFGSVALQRDAPSDWIFQKGIFIIYFLPPVLTRRHQRMCLLCAFAQQRNINFEYCMGGEWKGAWIFSPPMPLCSVLSIPSLLHPSIV